MRPSQWQRRNKESWLVIKVNFFITYVTLYWINYKERTADLDDSCNILCFTDLREKNLT